MVLEVSSSGKEVTYCYFPFTAFLIQHESFIPFDTRTMLISFLVDCSRSLTPAEKTLPISAVLLHLMKNINKHSSLNSHGISSLFFINVDTSQGFFKPEAFGLKKTPLTSDIYCVD